MQSDACRIPSSRPTVMTLASTDDISKCVAEHSKLVIKFTAEWCGPCKMIEPKARAIAEEFGFAYAHVDVDNVPDAVEAYDISGMPTFVFFIRGAAAECRVVGCDAAGLRTACESLSRPS